MTGKIFLNYRRADSDVWAHQLFGELIKRFPRDNIFMDVDGSIPVGLPWAKWLDQQVAACDLMLVLIGRTWVKEFTKRANQRDHVRIEIESALARQIPVVPVFLGDAPIPAGVKLPELVRPLLDRQAARLELKSLNKDTEMLLSEVARSIDLTRSSRPMHQPAKIGHGGAIEPVSPASSEEKGRPASQPTPAMLTAKPLKEMATLIAKSKDQPRGFATNAVQQGLRSIAPPETSFIFSSSRADQLSMETDALQGGVFTHYLLRGLSGEASREKDGSVRVSELAHFIISSVMQFTKGRQSPVYQSSSTEGDPVILGPGSEFTKTVVVAIGISDYPEPLANLRYTASDANRVADLFQQHGALIHRIVNATRGSLLNAVQSAVRDIDDGSLLIFYFAGHGAVGDDGRLWLLPVDANREMLPATALSTVELKEGLFRAPARVKVLFLDTSFWTRLTMQK